MITVPFEPEEAEFGILIPGIPLPEESQKECGLSLRIGQILYFSLLRITHLAM